MSASFESAKELREVIDAVFTMMDADSDMGPKLRDADTPQQFEFSDFDVVVNIRAATRRRGGQPVLGVVRGRRLEAEGADDDVLGGGQPLLPGQGERRDGRRAAADQDRRGHEGRARPDPDHQADLRGSTATTSSGRNRTCSCRSIGARMADSLTDVARALSVSPATLRRWVAEGIVPLRDGRVDAGGAGPGADRRADARPRALAGAVARARPRRAGSPTGTSRTCSRSAAGRHAPWPRRPRETGLEPELIRRIWAAAGFPAASLDALSDDDLELLRRLGAVLDAGLPLVAFLQIVRVYGQALAQIADAEVKLFHLYVHEPMIRDGAPVLEIAEELSDLASELLPLTGPIMDARPPAAAAPLPRAGRRRAPGGRRRRGRAGPDAGGDRVRRPRRLHAADRGGGRGGGARGGRALRRAGDRDAARRRARDQDDRRRGDGRRHGPERAGRLGGRLPGAARPSARCRASACTPAASSTATATTTAGR